MRQQNSYDGIDSRLNYITNWIGAKCSQLFPQHQYNIKGQGTYKSDHHQFQLSNAYWQHFPPILGTLSLSQQPGPYYKYFKFQVSNKVINVTPFNRSQLCLPYVQLALLHLLYSCCHTWLLEVSAERSLQFLSETIFWQMARTAVFLCVKQNKKPCHCTRHDIIDIASQDLGADILLVICLYSVSYQHLLR